VAHTYEASKGGDDIAVQQLRQDQVADGMVANCPWGTPLDRWSDRMIERGLAYLAGDLDKTPDGEGWDFFPNLFRAMGDEARGRGIEV
jgi:hypothetical protein